MIWLILVGWWLSAIWVAIAWLLLMALPSAAAGLKMLAYQHSIVALKAPPEASLDLVEDTLRRMESSNPAQRATTLRVLYILVIGWWLSILWSIVAWGRSLSLHNRPSAVTMFMRTPAIMTLKRY